MENLWNARNLSFGLFCKILLQRTLICLCFGDGAMIPVACMNYEGSFWVTENLGY